jgi:AcrR family transcriptional regulator
MPRKPSVSTRKDPTQERSRRTVAAILTATSRILVHQGFEATTTTRVAEVAGVSIGSLYQYFPSKEALVAALVDEHISKILSLLSDSTVEDEPLERAVPRFIEMVLKMHAIDPRLHVVLTQHLPQVRGFEKIRFLNARAEELLLAYLERHRAEVGVENLRLGAFILVNCVQSVVSAAVLDETLRLDDADLHAELARLVLRFLAREHQPA